VKTIIFAAMILQIIQVKKILLSFLIIILTIQVKSQNQDSNYINYIQKYAGIAIKQQQLHRIPASIILAQGLLESRAGQSILVKEGNNHFGIKCHEWSGDKIYQDDDLKNECFRKYSQASESFEDHSFFLTSRPRYKELFNLPSGDYTSWAKGLKAAGYATDPDYAQKLINLIERYELNQYDKFNSEIAAKTEQVIIVNSEVSENKTREYYRSNHIKIIVANSTDTYSSLAKELNISEKRLRKYNDAGLDMTLHQGSIIYLANKKNKAACPNKIHVIEEGESFYSISQEYGIKLINLYRMNNLSFNESASVGQILRLR
jgi:LysM repeat protein